MAPVAAAVIGAGVAAYSARQGRKQQQPLVNSMTAAANQQVAQSKALTPYSTAFYQRAGEAYDPAAAYYKAAAAGGPQLLSAVAPDAALVGQKYGNAISTARSLYPRSGGGGNLYDMAFRAGDDTQRLVNEARSNAAGGLVKLAGAAGDIGGSAAAAGSRAAGTGITGLEAGLTGQQKINQSAADAIGQFNLSPEQWNAMGKWANGKKSPGTGTGTSSAYDGDGWSSGD